MLTCVCLPACVRALPPQAQEEMAWKIAKMIVNDVVNQADYESPYGKSTKVSPFHAVPEMTARYALVRRRGYKSYRRRLPWDSVIKVMKIPGFTCCTR